jgi:glycosyltransferase involved in cell wall biosynthesis
MTGSILLFVPAYNCEKQIGRVIAQLDERVSRYFAEVIIVNNRSSDGTERAALEEIRRRRRSHVKVLRNRDNYGLGGSHKVAFAYALGAGHDHVAVLHGDDQGRIDDLLPLLEQGEHRAYDCLLGARFHPASRLVGYSRFRTLGNRVFNLPFSVVAGRRLYDLGAGFVSDLLRALNALLTPGASGALDAVRLYFFMTYVVIGMAFLPWTVLHCAARRGPKPGAGAR